MQQQHEEELCFGYANCLISIHDKQKTSFLKYKEIAKFCISTVYHRVGFNKYLI